MLPHKVLPILNFGPFMLTNLLSTRMRGGSSNTVAERDTYRAGVVILSPKDTRIKIALRFGFKASNNEAEYEAPVAGLQTAESHEAKHLTVLGDSMLLVNQVKGEYQVKGEKLSAYKTQVQQLLTLFSRWEI